MAQERVKTPLGFLDCSGSTPQIEGRKITIPWYGKAGSTRPLRREYSGLEARGGQVKFQKWARGSEKQNAEVLHQSYWDRLRVLNLSSSPKSEIRGAFHFRLNPNIIESFIITAIWCRYSLDLLGSIASLKEKKLKSPRRFLILVSVFSRFK